MASGTKNHNLNHLITIGSTRILVGCLPLQKPGESRAALERRAAHELMKELVDGNSEICHHASGAPYLPSHPELHISISHSRSHIAVAVDSVRPIGIDIEMWRDSLPEVLPRVLSDAETRTYMQTAATMLSAWTIKEAAFKALQRTEAAAHVSTISQVALPELPPDIINTDGKHGASCNAYTSLYDVCVMSLYQIDDSSPLTLLTLAAIH